MKQSIDYKKIVELMCWNKYDGETYEDVFNRECGNPTLVPDADIVDVVHAKGLEPWAKMQKFETLEELQTAIMNIMLRTINSKVLSDKKTRDVFPSIRNFYTYCNRIDCQNAIYSEAKKIAMVVWYGELAQKRLKERTAKMFAQKPDKKRFNAIVEKIQDIWGLSDSDIDALRYFVCQTRHEDHNPSLNKAIYMWSEEKKTGKTTLARAIVSVLNGETSIKNSGQYESTLAKEMQYNDHDLPMAAYCNAVILDESMPKDSSKAYGQIKQMLTSNSCIYNPKYRQVITVKAKRFYFCTSNEDVSQFVQDNTERRFLPIHLYKIPRQLSFNEIYDIWKEFCVNATPAMDDWQKWYDSFKETEGLRALDIDYYIDKIVGDTMIVSELSNMSQTYMTPPWFHDRLVGKKTLSRDVQRAITGALDKLVGKPPKTRKSKYRRIDLINVISNLQNSENEDVFSNDDEKKDNYENNINDLPF